MRKTIAKWLRSAADRLDSDAKHSMTLKVGMVVMTTAEVEDVQRLLEAVREAHPAKESIADAMETAKNEAVAAVRESFRNGSL